MQTLTASRMTPSLLVLTDFFQAANRALDYATNLAEPLGARLVLLHVRRDSILDPELFTGRLSNLSKEAIGLALNSVTRGLAVPVVAEVGHGRVAVAASDAAARHHPTLIVLGRPDYSDEPDELVHTTCLDILRIAPYPMLVVPHGVVSTAPPRRVLLAEDGEPFALGKFSGPIHAMFKTLRAEITVLHVQSEANSEDFAPLALEAVRRAGLAEGLPPMQSLTVVNSNPAEGILAAVQPGDYDLVVLIARPRSFLSQLFHQSTTAKVLIHSALPVLIMPAQ